MASLLGVACTVVFATDLRAQCAARDILRAAAKIHKAAPPNLPPQLISAARDVPIWKTIRLGTFANSLALREALDAMGCGVGGAAAEILARPAFTVRASTRQVKLVAISAANLGFKNDTVTLAAIYARAQLLGFELVEAEVGPQLRMQYLDQPLGEFLIMAMKPIKTWGGEPTILSVANGGAGLILIGQSGADDAEIAVASRLVFARSDAPAPGEEIGSVPAAVSPASHSARLSHRP